jgi:phage terminase small subunit
MPQRRVPTSTLEAKGSFLRHPERKRAREHEPKPTAALGQAPEHLGEDERRVWGELAAKFQPGVCGDSDEMAFEVLCCLVTNFRRRVKLNLPHVVGELSAMSKLFSQFGMTPTDRSRVTAEVPKPTAADDPLAEFVQ